jgi:hypothetical protein
MISIQQTTNKLLQDMRGGVERKEQQHGTSMVLIQEKTKLNDMHLIPRERLLLAGMVHDKRS